MLRRLGIRTKVLAVLAVPVLVLLVLSGYISLQSFEQSRTASAVEDVVRILPRYAQLAESLQQERTLSMQSVSDNPLSGSIQAARTATDDSVASLENALTDLDVSPLDPRVEEAIAAARNQQAKLESLRQRVTDGSVPATLVDSNYTDIIAAANDVPALVAETLSERSLASRLTAYGYIADTIEQILRAQPTAIEVFGDDGRDASRVRELASLFAVQDAARSDARAATNNLHLSGIQLPSRDADLTALQLSLVSGNELMVSVLDSNRWNTLTNAELAGLRPVADDLLASASSLASSQASAAQREALLTIAATALATALSVVIAFVVSRGIVIPLRRLTSAAGEVREELPRLVEQVAVPGETPDLTLAEIPVESSDEVGRLAAAFNSVNSTTIQVAREQAALRGSIAEMFVNVARRDQVLLGRQLSFIDQLERTEEDPAALANLFRLDHLATRMRRNAESLLVLAGIDSGRRLREAMPLSDVIRTASSEIEQYDRVQLELRADPLMHGFNALAAAHLLAELLENATLFSEPGTPVVVSTGVSEDLVTVQVIDQGLGMTPEELAEANATIGATAATDAIGAQRLGLFVVARLARRLGAHVRLERASGHHSSSGTMAVVAFPAALFTSHDPALAGQPASAPESRQVSGPATGAIPEAPAAVPVDLAALTDGETPTGLPKRRTSGAQAPSEPEVVLPAPAEATLAPEIAAATEVWTPQIPAAGPAALPTRTALPSRGEAAVLPTRTPTAPAAPEPEPEAAAAQEPTGSRSGLFAGFRGRDALPRLTELPITDEEPSTPEVPVPSADPAEAAEVAVPDVTAAPGAEPEAETPVAPAPAAWTADAWAPGDWAEPADLAADPHAEELARPLTAPVPVVPADLVAAPEIPALAPEPEPEAVSEPVAAAPLVVPGLIPDEPVAADDWSWSSAAQDEVPQLDVPQVAETADPAWSAAEPWAPTEAQADGWAQPAAPEPVAETWAPAEPSAWADLPAPMGQPVAGLPAPVEPAAPVQPEWSASAEPQWSAPEPVAAPAAPEPALPTRASAFHAAAAPLDVPTDVPAAPSDVAVPGTPAPADAAPLPDFAALVQGDGREEAHRERPRKKRQRFSFGRRKPAEAPVAPAASAAPSAERPTWTSSAAWSAGEEVPAAWTTPVDPAPAPAPVTALSSAPTEPETVAGSWDVAPAVAASPAPEPAAPVWAPQEPSVAPTGTGWAPQEPAAQAPAAPLWAISPENEPTQPAWAPQEPASAATPGWSSALPTRTPAPVPPPVDEPSVIPSAPVAAAPRDVSAWASAWSPEGGTAGSGSVWASGATTTAGAPTTQHSGALDAEAAAMLAQRADIQEQALSELSQLSAYRPTVVDRPANGSLTRRVPTAIPAAPEIQADTAGTTARDADGLRSRLSSFQSGTRRGRRAQPGSESGDVPAPGAEPTPDQHTAGVVADMVNAAHAASAAPRQEDE